MEPKQRKTPAIRWRGILAQQNRTVRITVAIVLAAACFSLTFVQLGFAGVGFEGDYSVYIVTLLQAIALGALLLGVVPGTLLGLFAGVVLYIHANVMPLDYYELSFVTPVTSIVVLTLMGFLLGILLAVALRKNPSLPRRVIRIILICFFVSGLYSLTFVVSAMITLVGDLANTYGSSVPDQRMMSLVTGILTSTSFRLGNVSMQVLLDALSMTVVCVGGDVLTRGILEGKHRIGLRTMFCVWLAVVFVVVFFAASAISFVFITEAERVQAYESMNGELEYLCDHLDDGVRSESVLESVADTLELSADDPSTVELSNYYSVSSFDELLKGYDRATDGTVLVTANEGLIVLSDDQSFAPGKQLSDYLGEDVLDAIDLSAQTGEVERVVYDQGLMLTGDVSDLKETQVKTYIAYLVARDASDFRVVMMTPFTQVFAQRGAVMFVLTISYIMLLLAVFALTSLLLSRVVVRRIDETNAVLGRITDGDLNARVEVRDTIELESLSTGINETVVALKGWIAEAETRMDAELATAKAIQESALPRTFPPFPDIWRFDVYATMRPAREVGGDFYDFFLIGADSGPDGGKLGFVIADVSGKGVPAALFMMNAKALIRGYLESGMQPGEAMENANRKLCDGNEAGMFVTAWVGVFDYATMRVEYVNAGHNPPLLWQKDSWQWMKQKSGLPLGLFEGLPYKAHSFECQVGDQLLLYTDGVTEAMNREGELYGEERLFGVAETNYPLHPRELVEAVRHDVIKYADGAEQSDDITILVLEAGVPPEVTATLIVPADVAELPRVNEFIHTELDRRLCPLRAQTQLDIAVEELFVNVAHYAYPEATPEHPGTVRVSYTYTADPPSVAVDISDDGIPYNPLTKPDAVTPDDIMDVPVGGLGIFMAKRSVDEMRYERVDGSNIVTIVKKW